MRCFGYALGGPAGTFGIGKGLSKRGTPVLDELCDVAVFTGVLCNVDASVIEGIAAVTRIAWFCGSSPLETAGMYAPKVILLDPSLDAWIDWLGWE